MTRLRVGLVATALVVLAVAGCTTGPEDTTNALDDVLARLPACSDAPLDVVAHDLPLPSSIQLASVSDGALQVGFGFARGSPGEVVASVAARDDVDVIWSEDEGFEAEVLIQQDDRRVFVRAAATCDGGSSVDIRSTELDPPP